MELTPGPILYIAMVLPAAMLYLSVRHHISIEQNRLPKKNKIAKTKPIPFPDTSPGCHQLSHLFTIVPIGPTSV